MGARQSGTVIVRGSSLPGWFWRQKPEIVPYPNAAEVIASRQLIRHAADVPVLLSAVTSRPNWLPTHNNKHFTQSVAKRTGLRFATPVQFFQALSKKFKISQNLP
jgi:hypothetical protein